MSKLLYLVHRLPFPPNKGDKVRSYHLLKHLLKSHQVFLGTFVDDPEDERYVERLRGLCADLHVVRLEPRQAKLRSLSGLLAGEPLTLAYYRNAALQAWVDQTCAKNDIAAAVVFSSSMAQYVEAKPELPLLVDFVDVDSAKWTAYADQHAWPMSWLYRREGKRLLAYERQIASLALCSFFVTEQETALFTSLAPECEKRVEAICNGVDADYFSPRDDRPSPFSANEIPLVFTGAMDYWPNIDAVNWFVGEIFPSLLKQHPTLRFYIVGRNPAAEVSALASAQVIVTGTLADVRPHLQHAAVVVAPLRVARGIQNKILEAMAMGRPVVAAQSCVDVLATSGEEVIIAAESAAQFVAQIQGLLAAPEQAEAIGQAGQACVRQNYSWDAHLARLDHYLAAATPAEPSL